MAGYTRQSTYTDGDVINAADSNDEFDQLVSAFSNSTGHTHDGTAAEGSRITVVGTAADNVTFGTALTPDANNTIDIGTSSNQFKNLYIDGTGNIDSLVADTADINGGTMDGVVIGGVTAAAADFTTVNSTGAMIATGGFQGVLTGSVLGNTTVTTGASTFNNVTVNGTMTGNVTGDLTGDVTGNADTATALETARNFSLTGDVTATAVSFDGSGNVALNGSLAAGVVDTAELAASAVTTAKIASSAVTDAKIATGTITNAKLANSSVTVNTNAVSLGGSVTLDTDDIGEGTSNLYFTNERVDDRVNGLLTAGSNITLTYDDTANTLTIASTDTEDDLSNNDTDDLSEGTSNLYYTNTRADARITNATGTSIQAYDAGLTSIAGLTTAANKIIYTTASDTYAVTDFTSFGRSLVDDADASAARTTLGLGTAATSASTDFVAVSGDDVTGNINFADNAKARFGAGNDLQIYHDGSNSYIAEGGDQTGDLFVRASNLKLTNASGDFFLWGRNADSVRLYHNNAQKLETTATGIDVTGTVTMDGGSTSADFSFGDNDKALFGAGNDLQVYHDGTNSYILENGTGNLIVKGNAGIYLRGTNDENMGVFLQDGASTLYHNNAAKLATTSTGVSVTGTLAATAVTGDGSGLTNLPATGDGGIAMAIALG